MATMESVVKIMEAPTCCGHPKWEVGQVVLFLKKGLFLKGRRSPRSRTE
jgi:hypothetical protein